MLYCEYCLSWPVLLCLTQRQKVLLPDAYVHIYNKYTYIIHNGSGDCRKPEETVMLLPRFKHLNRDLSCIKQDYPLKTQNWANKSDNNENIRGTRYIIHSLQKTHLKNCLFKQKPGHLLENWNSAISTGTQVKKWLTKVYECSQHYGTIGFSVNENSNYRQQNHVPCSFVSRDTPQSLCFAFLLFFIVNFLFRVPVPRLLSCMLLKCTCWEYPRRIKRQRLNEWVRTKMTRSKLRKLTANGW